MYWIPCAGANAVPCDAAYDGETGRLLHDRLQQHVSSARRAPGIFSSLVFQHLHDTGHHLRREDASILARDDGNITRGIREALYIKALNPSLNRDQGRHTIPPIFDNAIRKLKKRRPPAPEIHQPGEALFDSRPKTSGRPRTTASSQSAPSPITSRKRQANDFLSQPLPKRPRPAVTFFQPAIDAFLREARQRADDGTGGPG